MHKQRGWVTELLRDLLAVPSESCHETDAMELLQQRLNLLNVVCDRVPMSNAIKHHPDYSFPLDGVNYDGRWNLRVILPGKSGKSIAFNSHMDVVPPSPNQTDAYSPRLDNDGNMFARGACDAKGQIVVMALLLKVFSELEMSKNTLVFDFVVEEEIGGNGTLSLLDSRRTPLDALVNLEPTDLRIMTSIRGAVWFDATFSGLAGHSGNSTGTVSALEKAINAIAELKCYHAQLLKRSHHYPLFAGLENPMPLTIGKLCAGNWPSTVPGSANLAGVLGFLPNENKDSVIDALREILGVDAKFTYRHNAVELDTSHPLAIAMKDAANLMEIPSEFHAMTASTDAIFYQEKGTPSLAFGPGSLANAHSCSEHIAIEDILLAASTLYSFANTF